MWLQGLEGLLTRLQGVGECGLSVCVWAIVVWAMRMLGVCAHVRPLHRPAPAPTPPTSASCFLRPRFSPWSLAMV